MASLETIFVLLFAAVLLVGIAQKVHVPYPIALVLGGMLIGFIPEVPVINFDPDLILLAVLPPILYYAAYGTAIREFQKNWRDIFSLALGLVVFTTLVIGVLFRWMFPQFSWALAFAFGAIVSPPDAVSATAILRHFSINPRLTALLEGESLVNDASAIVLYKIAVTALLSGSFSLVEGGVDFFREVVVGVSSGLILGLLMQLFSRRYLEPVLAVLFSFTIPYLTFIIANHLGGSGVLAVVVNGLIGARILQTHPSSLRRVLGYATWDIFNVLLNCFVFVLIGLQLRTITKAMTMQQIALYAGYACLTVLAMVAVRMLWVFAEAGIAHIKAKKPLSLRESAIIGWSGMRGIVSLAVAIGLPAALAGRNEVIFMTFVVILITLVIPGLTLPLLIRWLIPGCTKKSEEGKIRALLIKVAQEKLKELQHSKKIAPEEFEFLKNYFITQHRVLENFHAENHLEHVEAARLEVIRSQREILLELWERQEIDDRLLNHMENELDIVEIHIVRGELH